MAPSLSQGLYDPNDERDACGFGMVAQLDDQPSRLLVDTAIAALSRMTHRGGVAADGVTGDGCGLLLRRPEAFLQALPHDYYEENNLHAFLIEAIRDYGTALAETEKFLPYIDNWATCDFPEPKCFRKNKKAVL